MNCYCTSTGWTLELSHGLDCCLQLRDSDACCFENVLRHKCPFRPGGCLSLGPSHARFNPASIPNWRCRPRVPALPMQIGKLVLRCAVVAEKLRPFLQRPLDCGLPGICAARRYQNHSYVTCFFCGQTYSRQLGRGWKKRICQMHGQFSQESFF